MARQWTGFGAPQDKPAALAMWTTLAFSRDDASPILKARAYSSLAKCWLSQTHGKRLATLNIDRLYDAGHCANQAIALGLITGAALSVAEKIESAGFRRPEDNKFPEHSTERFERLTALWGALDARDAGVAEEKLKGEAKLAEDPLGYFCAAEDCGIMVTKKYTLWSCGGGCPRALKPHYCSKACQRAVRFPSHTNPKEPRLSALQDRKHHGPFCRPDATVSSLVPANRTDTAVIQRRPNPPEGATPERYRQNAERTVRINVREGFILLFSSDSVPPHTMREMKERLESGTWGCRVQWLL